MKTTAVFHLTVKMIKTFCFAMAGIQLVMFIVSLCIPPFGFDSPSNNPMLGMVQKGCTDSSGPKVQALLTLGALYGPYVRYNYELWRLITPILLHAGMFV